MIYYRKLYISKFISKFKVLLELVLTEWVQFPLSADKICDKIVCFFNVKHNTLKTNNYGCKLQSYKISWVSHVIYKYNTVFV